MFERSAPKECDIYLYVLLAFAYPSQAIRAAAIGLPTPEPEVFPMGVSKEAFRLSSRMVRHMRLADGVSRASLAPFPQVMGRILFLLSVDR